VQPPDLDQMDHAILAHLQTDARTIAETIGARVGLSAAAVQRRIKRLRQAGVIEREVAVLDPGTLGYAMTFIVAVEMERERTEVIEDFQRQVLADDAVQQCYYVTGTADFVLVVTCRDMADFEEFTRRMFFTNGEVRHFTTSVVMNRMKVGLTVPLVNPDGPSSGANGRAAADDIAE
jgi:Lrp/AsnC family leucine-responsive transcriptional regulator